MNADWTQFIIADQTPQKKLPLKNGVPQKNRYSRSAATIKLTSDLFLYPFFLPLHPGHRLQHRAYSGRVLLSKAL